MRQITLFKFSVNNCALDFTLPRKIRELLEDNKINQQSINNDTLNDYVLIKMI